MNNQIKGHQMNEHLRLARKHLDSLIQENLNAESLAWYRSAVDKVMKDERERDLYMAFSAVPRHSGKAPLSSTAEQKMTFQEIWSVFLGHFSIDQLTRIALILHLPDISPEEFSRRVHKLWDTADMGEQMVLFKGLPFFPFPESYVQMAAEGIRTNIADVYDAIALENPFPAQYLPPVAWNQMVLKGAFMERPIARILGFPTRANEDLDRIVSDYAHERWAAGREITPEIWQAVSPAFLQKDSYKKDLQRLLQGSPFDREAVALLIASHEANGNQEAEKELETEINRVHSGDLTWENLSKRWHHHQEA